MCSQHTACRSDKAQKAPFKVSSCSPATPSKLAIEAEGVSCCSTGSDCGSSGAASIQSPDDEEGVAPLASKSWVIQGMDCPACAQKVEKAVNKIDGIASAQVRFTTQKLVVKLNKPLDQNIIVDAIEAIGFTVQGVGEKVHASTAKQTGWRGILSNNLLLISLSVAMLLSAAVNQLSPELGKYLFAAVCIVGLYPIASKAFSMAKSGTPFSIETLMTVAAIGALYLGETVEAAMVLLLFLLGEHLEAYASNRARSGVQALMALVPENATVIRDGERVEVAASELNIGDVIEVAPGDRLPSDGMLLDSSASFDESALTGESIPVEHTKHEAIMAGSVVVDQVVRIQISSAQGENAIDRILHLIEEAESRKAPLERFLDKFSRWYTPLMMLVALLVIITPPLLFAQPWETWLYRGLALLLIACPCALVISTPAAITSGLATAARHGALIKGGAALEQLGRVNAVAFDKTGTLTQGKPQVTDVEITADMIEEDLLTLAAAVEVGSNHPLAKSLVQYVESKGILVPEATNKKAILGQGVSGVVNGSEVRLIAPSKLDVTLSESMLKQIEQLEEQGKTVVAVLVADAAKGLIAWQDTIREDAKQAVAKLDKMGIRSIMLTGDNPVSAHAIASQVGMEYQASLLPQDKVTYVEQLANETSVAMVGDGINDAPAMKAASIGIAMGGGTDVALETADAALTHNRLAELPFMIQLSQATLRNIKQNVTLALGLKGVFLVTSLMGITGLWVAVLADSGATALVTLNALRLLRMDRK
ncbi:zinc/cadmium/mercury/lead-transporting ATPase [Vibrio tapetis subsp. quintayensis]|uniref:zinc/cadmium/mercury/lead-transporting ATPase n=1 Tax=Vibrio tapetis TaxID=52443 RepID=UPI0025B455A4|nr:zinc/cadmium/mercury/lead-transporting ATPase [Vibrio tapetis]MDN3679746.1 zinc/cadmium/mercury/lead-transporting ATPase [Vibrio tapetis subsp. quintayensis]